MTNYTVHVPDDHKAKVTLAMDLFLKKRIDYDGGTQPVYIGYAAPGTATGTAKWAIKKLTYDGVYVTQEDWADSSNNFDKEWDERASYTYA